MRNGKTIILWLLLLPMLACKSPVQEQLILTSDALDADIEVQIYETEGRYEQKPIIYFTDSEEILSHEIFSKIKTLTLNDSLSGAYYVFVGSINKRTGENERERFFFCNETYLSFFKNELIPAVEFGIGTNFNPVQRSLVGISFGGLNAAYFSAKTDLFQHYALLSPITFPCPDLNTALAFSEQRDLDVYISTGTNDAEHYTVPLVNLFRSKNHSVHYVQTEGGHDFNNWKGQMAEALNFLMNTKVPNL